MWLHGRGGHAFFQAEKDIGLKATPRCPAADGLSTLLRTSMGFLRDWETKLETLYEAMGEGTVSLRAGCEIILNSHCGQSKLVHDIIHKYGVKKALFRFGRGGITHKAFYEIFFKCIHPPGATIARLEECYRFRWCRLLGSNTPMKLAVSAATHLKWLGKRLPSRVHLANVRFQFNGWHTARRYQRRVGSSCPFCNNEAAEDSIEHFVYCPAVHTGLANFL